MKYINRRLGRSVGGVLLVFLVAWSIYFFFIDWDVRIQFPAKTVPGVAMNVLRNWSEDHMGNLDNLQVDSLTQINQKYQVSGRAYLLNWKFNALNDSIVQVIIEASEPGNRFYNKLLAPISEAQIEADVKALGLEYYRSLKEYLASSKTNYIGKSSLPEVSCMCSSLVTPVHEKAAGMMSVYNRMISFLNQHHIELGGMPQINVTSWKHSKGELNFDFCFPIADTVKIPSNEYGFFKKVLQKEAVFKAEYYGNYINSDRAWYELVQKADAADVLVIPKPREIFYKDPNLGADEMTWKTEVFLPISEVESL